MSDSSHPHSFLHVKDRIARSHGHGMKEPIDELLKGEQEEENAESKHASPITLDRSIIEPTTKQPSDYKTDESTPIQSKREISTPKQQTRHLQEQTQTQTDSEEAKRFQECEHTAAALLVRCLEAEGVRFCYGIPGEETAALNMALQSSSIRTILTRHEQGASFMADAYGRLTGKASVCFATLGPGATNILTGVANANMDHIPLIVITGQAEVERLHRKSHQLIDTVSLFEPITKWSVMVHDIASIPEIIRKAFRIAQNEKPGSVHISLPADIALKVVPDTLEAIIPIPCLDPVAALDAIEECYAAIKKATKPLILVGHGVVRKNASKPLEQLCSSLRIPCIHTTMANGVLSSSHPQNLFTIATPGGGPAASLFHECDLVLCIGYDIEECPAKIWNHRSNLQIIHIDATPAEVDQKYEPFLEVIGDVSFTLKKLNERISIKREQTVQESLAIDDGWYRSLRAQIMEHRHSHDGDDTEGSLHPIKILADLKSVLTTRDIVVSDVGCHMLWAARYFQCDEPNTLLLAGSFSSMGFGLPSGIASKLAYPNRRIVCICGDGGFLMQMQEMETAKRTGANLVVLVWVDNEYGMISMEQQSLYGHGHHSDLGFSNPNFIQLAHAFGWKGYHVTYARDFKHTLEQAFQCDGPVLIAIDVDYTDNHLLMTAGPASVPPTK